jgi:uncharacterized membrane protein
MSISCTACGAETPEYSGFCPACGRAISRDPAPISQVSTEKNKLLAPLAYITFIPAVVFLLVDPYKKNRYVRFHSFQCLFLCGALVIIAIALGFFFKLLSLIPLVGHLLTLLAWPVLSIGCFLLWLVLLVKAYQGEIFKLPVIGNWAERQANAI